VITLGSRWNVLRCLLEAGSQIGTSPLVAAVRSAHVGCTAALLACGAQVDAADHLGRTTLHFLALGPFPPQVVARAVVVSKNPSATSLGSGVTALMIAARAGRCAAVACLLVDRRVAATRSVNAQAMNLSRQADGKWGRGRRCRRWMGLLLLPLLPLLLLLLLLPLLSQRLQQLHLAMLSLLPILPVLQPIHACSFCAVGCRRVAGMRLYVAPSLMVR
jgi:hypothetical protein